MVRAIRRVVLGGPVARYQLACGHEVTADDYKRAKGQKSEAFCPQCWSQNVDKPTTKESTR